MGNKSQIQLSNLKPTELVKIINSTPAGTVISTLTG